MRKLHDTKARLRPAATLGDAWRPDATGPAANALIRARLATGEPTMITRFGSGELDVVMRHLGLNHRNPWRARLDYVWGAAPPPWWEAGFLADLRLHAGIFPTTPEVLSRFAELMLADMRLIDVLGSWLPGEADMVRRGLTAKRVPLQDLEPYFHESPWSQVLAGRTVLVIHPLAALIAKQCARRSRLFRNPGVLPDFELRTITAVVSNGGVQPVFPDWFAALDSMIDQVSALHFDVAIIGAGAYGLPLAAAVKRRGKQAVHLGGAMQLLFGIRGKRWDRRPEFQQFFNEAWVWPDAADRPPRAQEMEGGGDYW